MNPKKPSSFRLWLGSFIQFLCVGALLLSVVARAGEHFFLTPKSDAGPNATYIQSTARTLGVIQASLVSRTMGAQIKSMNFGLAVPGAPGQTISAMDKTDAATMKINGTPKQCVVLAFPKTAQMTLKTKGRAPSSSASIEVKNFHNKSSSTLAILDDKGSTLQNVGASIGPLAGNLPLGSYNGSFTVDVIFQ